MTWEQAYVAMSAALGEPLADVLASLDERAVGRAGALPGALASGDKGAQARALAEALLAMKRELDTMALQ